MISKVGSALNLRQKSINGSRVLELGIAYKKNVDDMRESPSVILMEKLRDLKSQTFDAESIASYDCVVLATDHDKFDYALLKKSARLIVDARGKFLEPAEHIVKA